MAMMNQGNTIERKYKGKSMGFYLNSIQSNDGVILCYQNRSNEYIWHEKLQMKLDNCFVYGNQGTYMEITVPPNSEEIL